jgi:hypothetical protein
MAWDKFVLYGRSLVSALLIASLNDRLSFIENVDKIVTRNKQESSVK